MLRFLAAIAFCCVATGVSAAEPISYEAFYELSVKDWKLPGEVLDVSGSQIVRAERDCTDWKLIGAFRLDAKATQGSGVQFETDVEGIEAINGTRLRFRSTTKANGAIVAQIAGTATRPAAGQPGRIVFTQPEPKTLPLPPEALFPIAAFRWTSAQWEKGQKNANYVLFDGTTPDPVRVFEILTDRVAAPTPMPDGDVKLLDGKAWRTSGSFHAYDGNSAEPLTTLIQNVMPNGVATELSLDIGFADVVLTLRRIRALPEPPC